jgi:hypothetical protein
LYSPEKYAHEIYVLNHPGVNKVRRQGNIP